MNETTPSTEAKPEDHWNQLRNAVVLACKQDQIVWAVFGVFWAANAVFVRGLFPTGDAPRGSTSMLNPAFGLVLSVVWLVIQHRAIGLDPIQ